MIPGLIRKSLNNAISIPVIKTIQILQRKYWIKTFQKNGAGPKFGKNYQQLLKKCQEISTCSIAECSGVKKFKIFKNSFTTCLCASTSTQKSTRLHKYA